MDKKQTIIKELKKHLKDVSTPRYQAIMRMRWGLDDGITRTLEEVGKEFGITRERVRQIENKILEQIKVANYQPNKNNYEQV